jgi:crotonobetainyl-CoA:carnitine CoA-transferase CaiB-like acyl-CoA transferase
MLALPQFADRNARIENYEGVVAFLAPIFATRPREEWRRRLRDHEVPSSPVYSSEEALKSDQIRHLQIEVAADGPMGAFRTIRNPVSFDGERALEISAPPVLGADNEAVLGRRPADRAAE